MLYLELLRGLVKKQVNTLVKDDIPLEDFVYEIVLNILKNYKKHRQLKTQFFPGLSVSDLENVKKVDLKMIAIACSLTECVLDCRKYSGSAARQSLSK